MLITPCIRGLEPFWQNTYAQYVVRNVSINNMTFSVEKVFFVERYLKTESFKTIESLYSPQFGYPAPEKSLIRMSKTVQTDRKCVFALAHLYINIINTPDFGFLV
jgi:hypothetical protein